MEGNVIGKVIDIREVRDKNWERNLRAQVEQLNTENQLLRNENNELRARLNGVTELYTNLQQEIGNIDRCITAIENYVVGR